MLITHATHENTAPSTQRHCSRPVMSAKIHNVPAGSSGTAVRKKRKMAVNDDQSDAVSGIGKSFVDGASESARRRWRLLQKHVCITQWLAKDLLRCHLKRFALSQQSIVDAVMHSKEDFMEVFVKIRVRARVLLSPLRAGALAFADALGFVYDVSC